MNSLRRRTRPPSHLKLELVACVLLDPGAEALDGGEDVVGGLGRSEGSGMLVVGVDEGVVVGLELQG